MRILKENLKYCEAAQDLLAQTPLDLEVDIAILHEFLKLLSVQHFGQVD